MSAVLSADLHTAARDCVSWGFAVFPLHYPIERDGGLVCSCGNSACASPAKHPYAYHAPRGLLDATTDPLQVGRRFRARAGTAGTWLVRRQPPGGGDSDIYLRAFTSSISVSSNAGDRELAAHWFQAAHPRWSPEACRKRAKKALRKVQR